MIDDHLAKLAYVHPASEHAVITACVTRVLTFCLTDTAVFDMLSLVSFFVSLCQD